MSLLSWLGSSPGAYQDSFQELILPKIGERIYICNASNLFRKQSQRAEAYVPSQPASQPTSKQVSRQARELMLCWSLLSMQMQRIWVVVVWERVWFKYTCTMAGFVFVSSIKWCSQSTYLNVRCGGIELNDDWAWFDGAEKGSRREQLVHVSRVKWSSLWKMALFVLVVQYWWMGFDLLLVSDLWLIFLNRFGGKKDKLWKMVLGDHGRKVLTPLTVTQSFARFPWAKFYKNSLYFRAMCGTGVVVASAWAYIILKGKFWREFL